MKLTTLSTLALATGALADGCARKRDPPWGNGLHPEAYEIKHNDTYCDLPHEGAFGLYAPHVYEIQQGMDYLCNKVLGQRNQKFLTHTAGDAPAQISCSHASGIFIQSTKKEGVSVAETQLIAEKVNNILEQCFYAPWGYPIDQRLARHNSWPDHWPQEGYSHHSSDKDHIKHKGVQGWAKVDEDMRVIIQRGDC